MNFGDWLLFSSIALVATLSPGPAILLVTSHSFSFGLRRSVATMLGNVSGLFLMSALSVAGLSAVILHSTAVFTLVKLLGAAYLVYLGIRLIRNGFGNSIDPAATGIGREQLPSFKRGYLQGLLVALSNPKAIAFTTALFPQFIDQSQAVLPQFAILVATFMLLSFSCLFAYAMLSAGARRKARGGSLLPSAFAKVFGTAFIISGGLLAGVSPSGSGGNP